MALFIFLLVVVNLLVTLGNVYMAQVNQRNARENLRIAKVNGKHAEEICKRYERLNSR